MLGSGIAAKVAVSIALAGVVGGAAVITVAATGSGPDEGVVATVVDGDTLDVTIDGRRERVRLLNIDTPELGDCLAAEATAFLEGQLPVGTVVRLEYDDVRLDRYERTLAGVFAGDVLVNATIARAGLGAPVMFDGNDRFLPDVEQAAASASMERLGLHSADVSCTVPGMATALDDTVAQNPTAMPQPAAPSMDFVAALAAPNLVLDAADVLGDLLALSGRPDVAVLPDDVRASISRRVAEIRAVAQRDRSVLQQAAAERAAAERVAAERAEAERIAEEARRAEEQRELEQRRAEEQREEEQRRAEEEEAQERADGPRADPAPDSPVDDPYPGYTGPRCYAPGGQTWRPC